MLIYSEEAFKDRFGARLNFSDILPRGTSYQIHAEPGSESFPRDRLQFIKFRMGGLLNTINSLRKYTEAADIVLTTKTPVFSDYRFERELSKFCPELPFSEAGEQTYFVLAECFGLDAGELIPVAMNVEVKDELSAKKRKDIKVTWDKKAFLRGNNQGYYMWRDGEGNKGSRKGRLYAADEFIKSGRVYDNICDKIIKYWNTKLNSAQQKEKLLEIKGNLDRWYEHTVHKDLRHILNLQRKAIKDKIGSGNYAL